MPAGRDRRCVHDRAGPGDRRFHCADAAHRRRVRLCAGLPDRLRAYPAVDRHPGRISGFPRFGYIHPVLELQNRFSRAVPGRLPEHLLRPHFPHGKRRVQSSLLHLRSGCRRAGGAGSLYDPQEQAGEGLRSGFPEKRRGQERPGRGSHHSGHVPAGPGRRYPDHAALGGGYRAGIQLHHQQDYCGPPLLRGGRQYGSGQTLRREHPARDVPGLPEHGCTHQHCHLHRHCPFSIRLRRCGQEL